MVIKDATSKDNVDEQAYIAQICICTRFRIASRKITKIYDDALLESGLSISQFALLATLKFDGNTSLTDIADSLGLDRTTLSRNLKPLERRGLISIKLAGDKRKRLLFLSKSGNELLESAIPKWREVQNQTIIALGPEKQQALISDLNLFINIKS